MSIPVVILVCKIWLMRIGLSALAAIAIGGAGRALWRTIHRPLAAAWQTPHMPDLAVLACLCVACIMYGGDKLRGLPGVGNPSVTADEIAQGYRLESVATNAAISYSMPTDGVECVRWSLRGGRETRFALDLGDFFFPFGTGMVSRLDILSGGMVESLPRPSLASIRAARELASLIPGESRFWRADADGGAVKLLTWENVYAGRDRTGAYSAQIELRDGGDFATRSNSVERVYRRVPPFDWDGDGLENSVDPDPLAAGPDARGTNSEWYNTVCSNIVVATPGGSGVSPLLEWRDGVNSNAYYFVDVVAEKGPVPIYFTGDRESRLGNPVVVALGSETNRVPLLIGIRYAVTSDVPFTVSFTDSGFATIATNNGPRSAEVIWPLEFTFTEGFSSGGRVYAIDVVPYDPGGTFSWEMRGGVSSGGLRSGGCSCVSYSGRSIVFGCSAQCDCGGTCVAFGTYNYELAGFDVSGGECRCGYDDPPTELLPTYDPTNGPNFSISFSKSAVIFEDAYQDGDGTSVPRRSTRVRLTVSAYGGTQGGTLLLAAQNLGRLTAVAGGQINLPQSLALAAGNSFYTTCVFEGVEASQSADDISVSGYFVENGSGDLVTESDSLTAVQLLITPATLIPQNCPNRHTFGVCEGVSIWCFPNSLNGFTWDTSSMILEGMQVGNVKSFDFLLEEGACYTTFTYKNVRYTVNMTCLRPHNIVCLTTPTVLPGNAGVGQAGGIGMNARLTVMPNTVCFNGLRIMERVTENGVPDGYFNQEYFRPWWSHGKVQGAGVLRTIGIENHFFDTAIMEDVCPELQSGGWMAGSITWTIPTAWRETLTCSTSQGLIDFTVKEQKFLIDAAGTVFVEKFNCCVERDVLGHTNATTSQ